MKEIILQDKSIVYYDSEFYLPTDRQFMKLWSLRPTEEQMCIIFGKNIEIPRRNKTFGVNYKFKGSIQSVEPLEPLNDLMIDIRDKIITHFNANLDIEGVPNSCLVNWYENGDEYIGYHSDDERVLVEGKPIYIVSLGEERMFKMKSKEDNSVVDFVLENGSLFVMTGTTQKTHKHSIPKTKKVKDIRISLTFRYVNV